MMELTGYGTLSNIQNKSNFHLLLVNFQFKIKFVSLKLSINLPAILCLIARYDAQDYNVTMSQCHTFLVICL